MTVSLLFYLGYLPECYQNVGFQDTPEGYRHPNDIATALYGIWWDKHNRLESEGGWSSLLHNMQWYRNLSCEDTRNRVYSIFAISGDTEDLGIKPDYSAQKTIDSLSKKLAIKTLTYGEDLWPLCLAVTWRLPDSKLPSWCLTVDYPDYDYVQAITDEKLSRHPIWKKAGLARFSRNKKVLIVKGRILETMSVVPISAVSPDYETSEQVFLASVLDMLLPEKLSTGHMASVLRCITGADPWSLPTDSRSSARESVAFHLTVYLRSELDDLLSQPDEPTSSIDAALQTRCTHTITSLSPFLPSSAIFEPDSETLEVQTALQRISTRSLVTGRVLGRTALGRCYNAFADIEVGDGIAALQGGDRLFIIRPVKDAYTLVGDIYVDGLMTGKAYQGLQPRKLDVNIRIV